MHQVVVKRAERFQQVSDIHASLGSTVLKKLFRPAVTFTGSMFAQAYSSHEHVTLPEDAKGRFTTDGLIRLSEGGMVTLPQLASRVLIENEVRQALGG